ncbi:topoisomerase [Clostridia bacterium]|nr:topoisomerase [Clostridia bacterium]
MGFFNSIATGFDAFFNADEYKDLGSTGERLTYRILDSRFSRKNIFRNVYLQRPDGKYTEIDLVAVNVKGVFVFESKNYSGWIFGSETQKEWTQSMPTGFKNKFYNPIKQNESHIKALQQHIAQLGDFRYLSFVVFSERCELKKLEYSSPDVYVLKRNELDAKLGKIFWDKGKCDLSDAQMKKIREVLSKAQRPESDVKEKHLEDVQEILETCPYCKGKLVERKRKDNGEIFYGCSNYPNCKYTQKELKQVTEKPKEEAVERAAAPEPKPPTAEKLCPKCGNPLVERTAKASGNKFYGCSTFPKCRYMEKQKSE